MELGKSGNWKKTETFIDKQYRIYYLHVRAGCWKARKGQKTALNISL